MINHIPAGRGDTSAHLRFGTQWLDDLRSSARAFQLQGDKLMVATPVAAINDFDASESSQVVPDEQGFEHVEIPSYISARQFLSIRPALEERIRAIAAAADVIQIDEGGHPMPLGVIGSELIGDVRPRIWVFGDTDPIERLKRVNAERNAAKRLVGHTVHLRIAKRLRDAVSSSRLVIAHDARLRQPFEDQWDERCHLLERVEIFDDQLAAGPTIEARRQRVASGGPLNVLVAGPQVAAGGTDHVLKAVQRCLRLQAHVKLTIAGTGPDLDMFRAAASGLNLTPYLRFVDQLTPQLIDSHDVYVEPTLLRSALTGPSRVSMALGAGLCPIAYDDAARTSMRGVVNVAKGDTNALADAILLAAADRSALISRMYAGLAWVKPRTIDATHRVRAQLARGIFEQRHKPAA